MSVVDGHRVAAVTLLSKNDYVSITYQLKKQGDKVVACSALFPFGDFWFYFRYFFCLQLTDFGPFIVAVEIGSQVVCSRDL